MQWLAAATYPKSPGLTQTKSRLDARFQKLRVYGQALATKVRDGALVRKRYHPPATPCQRLMANPPDKRGGTTPSAAAAGHAGPVRLRRRSVRSSSRPLIRIASRALRRYSGLRSRPMIVNMSRDAQETGTPILAV